MVYRASPKCPISEMETAQCIESEGIYVFEGGCPNCPIARSDDSRLFLFDMQEGPWGTEWSLEFILALRIALISAFRCNCLPALVSR